MNEKIPSYFLINATSADVDFIYGLRVQTMKPVFELTLGWNDREQYKLAANNLHHAKIIILNSKRVGVLKRSVEENVIYLHQIQILPKYQNIGIGQSILNLIIDESDQLGLPIELMVMKNTPAHHLYIKHGFSMIESFEHNTKMGRKPNKIKNI